MAPRVLHVDPAAPREARVRVGVDALRAGLIVAIPATIGYNYFVSEIDRFVIEMEETSAELIEELERLKG